MEKPENYLLKIEKTVGRAINRYSLINENDRVVVALSGGKDSLIMLETISERRKRLPISYEVTAVHVHIKNIGYETDTVFLKSFCASLNVPFYKIETEADLDRDKSKAICFICSWKRRKVLFDFMKQEKCNKLALGHHMDDAVETLLMNMISNGSMSSMPPSLPMFGGEFELIRPLILLTEDEIREYAELKNFPPQMKTCPYSENTGRASVKRLVQEFIKIDQNARQNIFNAMSNIHSDYLPPEE